MKRLLCVILIVVSLLGCSNNTGMDKALQLRSRLLQSTGCTFQVEITADYGQRQYVFSEKCESDENNSLNFQVLEPETICGITGVVDDSGGKLTFDNEVLAFPLLADGLLTPVSAPWILLHSLRSGYINACEDSSDKIRIIIHDTYQEIPLEVHAYCDSDCSPYFAEIFWDGRRIITLAIENFTIV